MRIPSCPKSSTCFFFSDISIFLRRKCYTRFFFSDISIFPNLYICYAWYGAMRHGFVSHGSLVHSHRDFRVRRSVIHRALNWLVTHNQYYRSNHVHIDVNALEQLPHDGNLSQLTAITVESAIVALKLLVSLISRLVACSARIVTDKQTNKQTQTQNDYCNPRCACAPRVNYYSLCRRSSRSPIMLSILLVIFINPRAGMRSEGLL